MFEHISLPSRNVLVRQDGATPAPAQRSVVLLDAGAERPRRHLAAAALSVGNLLYLASVGVVAIAIIGVFFGTGFLMLVPPAGGTVSGSATPNPGPEARPFLHGPSPLPETGQPPAGGKLGPGAGEASASTAIPLATRPAADEARSTEKHEAAQNSADLPASSALAAPAPASPNPGLSAAEITELLGHGDALLHTGDLASARLFYERAAAAGDGRAALRLGATFDPAFLNRAGLRNVKGDAAEARSWYARALDLGAAEAKRQLNRLDTRQGR